MKRFRLVLATAAAVAVALAPGVATAWGTHGHHLINQVAADSFPASMPAFTRTREARLEIRMLGSYMDDLKGSGDSWNDDNNPGHYLDLSDDGTIAGVVKLDALPSSRAAYNVALEAAHTSASRMGYLPYSILDGWEQLRRDFAYWRVATYRKSPTQAVWQAIVLRDIGVWGHFIGDGSQPLHVTVHYNGWGEGPNPNGFTTKPGIHSFFENEFVNEHATAPAVLALLKSTKIVPTATLLSQEQIMRRIVSYLKKTNQFTPEVYRLEKAGALHTATPKAIAFTDECLANGAGELRDLTLLAWYDSLNSSVGYPQYTVRSILAGHPVRVPRGD